MGASSTRSDVSLAFSLTALSIWVDRKIAPKPVLLNQTQMKNPIFYAFIVIAAVLTAGGGCGKPASIESYVISTEVPSELMPKKQRMLGAMFPRGDQVWFFKVTGPESSIAEMGSDFREFVEGISFADQGPLLNDLPQGWRRAADKPMRFASLSVETPEKQLDVSISSLTRQEDWDQQVLANVNRWRGQLGLEASSEPMAGGEVLAAASSDGPGVWVDLTGEPSNASAPMTPPFAGSNPMAPAATLSQSAETKGATTNRASNNDSRIQYTRPSDWRDGRASSMRLASFDVGPEDSVAEMTVIVAGGDLRGNVKRWLGQVIQGEASEEMVDQAIEESAQIKVDGREAQRFLMRDEGDDAAMCIDATIVPLDEQQNVFIKMTGPVKTVESQGDTIGNFLESLQFNF